MADGAVTRGAGRGGVATVGAVFGVAASFGNSASAEGVATPLGATGAGSVASTGLTRMAEAGSAVEGTGRSTVILLAPQPDSNAANPTKTITGIEWFIFMENVFSYRCFFF